VKKTTKKTAKRTSRRASLVRSIDVSINISDIVRVQGTDDALKFLQAVLDSGRVSRGSVNLKILHDKMTGGAA